MRKNRIKKSGGGGASCRTFCLARSSGRDIKISNQREGFTLAEVLIALIIIGIVAVFTLSTLINNFKERQYESAYKKFYYTMSSILMRMVANNELGAQTTSQFIQKFSKYANAQKICDANKLSDCFVDKVMTDKKIIDINSFSSPLYFIKPYSENNKGIVLGDGTSLIIGYDDKCKKNASDSSFNPVDKDFCMLVIVDLNGRKKPNTIGKDIRIMGSDIMVDRVCADPSSTCTMGINEIVACGNEGCSNVNFPWSRSQSSSVYCGTGGCGNVNTSSSAYNNVHCNAGGCGTVKVNNSSKVYCEEGGCSSVEIDHAHAYCGEGGCGELNIKGAYTGLHCNGNCVGEFTGGTISGQQTNFFCSGKNCEKDLEAYIAKLVNEGKLTCSTSGSIIRDEKGQFLKYFSCP